MPVHGRSQSLSLTLPPLGALFLKPIREPEKAIVEEAAAELREAEEEEAALAPA